MGPSSPMRWRTRRRSASPSKSAPWPGVPPAATQRLRFSYARVSAVERRRVALDPWLWCGLLSCAHCIGQAFLFLVMGMPLLWNLLLLPLCCLFGSWSQLLLFAAATAALALHPMPAVNHRWLRRSFLAFSLYKCVQAVGRSSGCSWLVL